MRLLYANTNKAYCAVFAANPGFVFVFYPPPIVFGFGRAKLLPGGYSGAAAAAGG